MIVGIPEDNLFPKVNANFAQNLYSESNFEPYQAELQHYNRDPVKGLGTPQAAGPGTRSVPGAAGGGRVLILDTSTPKSAQSCSSIGRLFNRRNRKMWSRAITGMRLPGRYYFLTLTTTPDSPPLVTLWNGLRQWLKRHRPGICWIYCFTLEGGLWKSGRGEGPGVIHMVIRLKMKQKRVDVKELRAWWFDRTGAKQVKIKWVPECRKDDLIAYLVNQKVKTGMAREMGYQSAVARWRWSKGWLPKGFTKAHARLWVDFIDSDPGVRLKAVNDLLHIMFEKERKSA